MGSLNGYLGRLLTLWHRVEETVHSSVASNGAQIETTCDGAKAEEQLDEDTSSPLEALPTVDSITATTDIRAFLKPGVPDGLKHAALRRAWAADPAIRDFIGIAENQWDFNKPQDIPGFGLLDPLWAIERLVPSASAVGLRQDENALEPPLESLRASEDDARRIAPRVDDHPTATNVNKSEGVTEHEPSTSHGIDR
jgi:hypothetical protein